MNAHWMDWAHNEMRELSLNLARQGFSAARIDYLNLTNPFFAERFGYFTNLLETGIVGMATDPESYYHFEVFGAALQGLLDFVGSHRDALLQAEFRQTA